MMGVLGLELVLGDLLSVPDSMVKGVGVLFLLDFLRNSSMVEVEDLLDLVRLSLRLELGDLLDLVRLPVVLLLRAMVDTQG